MTKFDHVEFTIGSHFLSELINGDASGATDEESQQLGEFVAGVQEERGTDGHWDYDSECDEFGCCEITGLHGTVTTVRYMFREPYAAPNFLFYWAAVSADAIFQAELVAYFGKHQASEMRYTVNTYRHEPLNVAKRQKLAADQAWLDYMQGLRA